MANFNSVEYAWKDLQVSLLGRLLVRILEVEYGATVEKKEIMGRGNKPLGVQTGNYKFKGKLQIGQSEYEAMVDVAKQAGKRVTDLTLDINIAYILDGVIKRDRVVGASFTEMAKGMKQGDTEMMIDLPWIAVDVLEGV